MKLIKPSFTIEQKLNGKEILKFLERAGRTCYKSESKITDTSAVNFIKTIIKNGHHTILEHEKITIRVICDRAITHCIVRHRLASYSQESTMYINYGKKGILTFIIPCWLNIKEGEYGEGISRNGIPNNAFHWFESMLNAEQTYLDLIEYGWTPRQARSILPNSMKTELVMTMNLREWRLFFKLRTPDNAHEQMQEVARPILDEFKKQIPIVFDDINYE